MKLSITWLQALVKELRLSQKLYILHKYFFDKILHKYLYASLILCFFSFFFWLYFIYSMFGLLVNLLTIKVMKFNFCGSWMTFFLGIWRASVRIERERYSRLIIH
jgi:hypothetical protein